MSDQAQPKRGGWLKAVLVGMLGLGGAAAGTYATALVDRVAKPTRPVANFALAAELSLAARASLRASTVDEAVQLAAALAVATDRNQWVQRAFDFAAQHRGAAERMAGEVLGLLDAQRL